MKNTKNKTKKIEKCCENCGQLIALGEGDHMCGACAICIPISNYEPTSDYFRCGGKLWCNR